MKHQEMTERTIQKLVVAGIELISKSGYGSTSVNQLVKKAGVSKGAFYAHFPSKEDFLMKILRDGIHFYFNDLQSILDQENLDLLEGFLNFSTSMVKEVYEKGFSPVLLQSAMICQTMPQVQEKLIELMETWREDLTRFLEEMKKNGIIESSLSTRTLATAAMALFNGYNLQHYIDNRINLQEMVEVFVKLLQVKTQ